MKNKPGPFNPTATNKGGFEMCPAGNHPGILLGLIDLGTHYESYKGQQESKKRRILFVFEVLAEVDGDDKRFWLGRDFSMPLDNRTGEPFIGQQSKLRAFMKDWRGKDYGDGEPVDIMAAHGQGCLVNVIHQPSGEKTYARVQSFSRLPRGMKAIRPTHDTVMYCADSDDEAPGQSDEEEWLPRVYGEKIHEVLERSLEWGGNGRRPDKSGQATSGAKSPADDEAF